MNKLNRKLNSNLSFSGCGFLGIYYVGVGVCFKKHASHLLMQKLAGVSAGAVVAVSLLLDLPLDEIAAEFFKIVSDVRSHSLGPFSPSFNIQDTLLICLKRHLPHDAHLKVTGRLHLSLTRIFDGKNVVVSQFNSREDLVDALACSFFIPFFSGMVPPKFHGIRYMDGAFSDNLVTLDDHTITVSPFSGESDICPKDDGSDTKFHFNLNNTSIKLSKENMRRLLRALVPPSTRELSELCQRGFDDALEFLYENELISCNDCSLSASLQLTCPAPVSASDRVLDPECNKCSQSRDNSVLSSMPEYLMATLEQHAQGPNSVLTKIFRVATLPVTVPFSVGVYFIKTVPAVASSISELQRSLTEKFHQAIVNAINGLMEMAKTKEESECQARSQKFNEKKHDGKKCLRRSGNS